MNCPYNFQTSSHCPLGIVLVSHRISKVDQKTVSKVLGYVSFKLTYHI